MITRFFSLRSLPSKAAAATALGICLSLSTAASAQETKIDALRQAATSSPRDPSAALAFGRALRRAGRYPEAARELRRGLGLAAGAAETALAFKLELARVAMDQQDFRGALAACKQVAAAPGGAALGHACTAMAQMVRRRATDALPEVEQALAASPGLYEAKLVQGQALQQNGTFEAAEQALREAIAKEPSRVEAYPRLAEVLALEGKRAEAIDVARKGRGTDTDDPDAAFTLGKLLAPGEEAAGALAAATAGRPSFTAAWVRLAEVDAALGRTEGAEKAALTAIKIDPKNANAHALLAQAYVAERKYDDGLREARAATGMMANLALAKLVEADALAGRGDIDTAIETYQTAFGLMRDDPAPLVRGSIACLAAGRPNTARAFAERATQLFPKWSPGWAALGDALARDRRERATAKQAYEKALAGEGPVDRPALEQKLAALR